jgi:hypothetical protein
MRRQVGRIEEAKARDLEADVRAGEMARHVRLAGERAGRMAAAAIHDAREILAARHRIGGGRMERDGIDGEHDGNHRRNGSDPGKHDS